MRLSTFAFVALALVAGSLASSADTGGGYCSVPAGAIVMWSGAIASIPPTWQLCDGTNGTPDLRSSFVKCVASAEEPGGTGGAASTSYTPAGTNSVPTFTGSALGAHSHGVGTYAVADHVYTPAGTVAAPTFTGNAGMVPAETITWPVGVPTAANESAHTHSVTAAGTNATAAFTPAGTIAWPVGVPTFSGSALGTHTHTAGTYADATSGATVKLFTSSASGVSAATLSGSSGATSGGTPAGTVAWPAGVPAFSGSGGTVPAETFTGSAVTSGGGSAHTHTLSWPAGVPTNGTASFTPAGTNNAPAFTGTQATLTHSVSGTSAAVSGGTPAGSVTAPTFTGNAATIATEPVFFKLAFIMRVR